MLFTIFHQLGYSHSLCILQTLDSKDTIYHSIMPIKMVQSEQASYKNVSNLVFQASLPWFRWQLKHRMTKQWNALYLIYSRFHSIAECNRYFWWKDIIWPFSTIEAFFKSQNKYLCYTFQNTYSRRPISGVIAADIKCVMRFIQDPEQCVSITNAIYFKEAISTKRKNIQIIYCDCVKQLKYVILDSSSHKHNEKDWSLISPAHQN